MRPKSVKNPELGEEKHYSIKVLQYNVLAEIHGVKNGMNFESCYRMEYRAPRVIKEIEEDDADVICLVEIDHYNDFYKPQL